MKKHCLLILFLGLCSQLFAQDASSIIDAHIKAIGGLKRWEEVRKIKLVRSHNYANGETYLNTVYLMPNHALRYESVLESGSNHIIYAVKEQQGWRLNTLNEGYQRLLITDIASEDCPFFLEETDLFYGLLNFQRADCEFENRGVLKRNGRELIELRMKDKAGKRISYFFDLNSHFLVEMTGDIAVIGMGMPLVATVQFDDYRSINGLMYPFKQTIAAKQLMFGQAQVFTLESIDLNATFDTNIFEKGQH
jgi:hypothetical protein